MSSRSRSGEKTLAELSLEHDIHPTIIRTCKRRHEAASAAVTANDDVVPASQLREAQQRIHELERLLGRKQMEIEILEAARDVVRESASRDGDLSNPADGRQTEYHRGRTRPAEFYRRVDDETVLPEIRAAANSRATYGYRCVCGSCQVE